MKEIVMGLALGLAAGFVCGGTVVGSLFQNDAIEHNCAEYDAKTGEWGWIGEVVWSDDNAFTYYKSRIKEITDQLTEQYLIDNCPKKLIGSQSYTSDSKFLFFDYTHEDTLQ